MEQNVSGSKPWQERALGEAVAGGERGEAGGIVVAWQDRLSRENGRATAEVWEALDKAGARLVCAAEGLDTATGDHGGAVFSAQAHDPSGISLS
jgi:DNA invertase Pin-like site-specific DNA recombinase